MKLYSATFQFFHLWRSIHENLRIVLNKHSETKEYASLCDKVSDAFPYQLTEISLVLVDKIYQYLSANSERSISTTFCYLLKAVIMFYNNSTVLPVSLVERGRLEATYRSLTTILKLTLEPLLLGCQENRNLSKIRYDTTSFGTEIPKSDFKHNSQEDHTMQLVEIGLQLSSSMVRLVQADRLSQTFCASTSSAILDQLILLQNAFSSTMSPDNVTAQRHSFLTTSIYKLRNFVKSLGGTAPEVQEHSFRNHNELVKKHYDDGNIFKVYSTKISEESSGAVLPTDSFQNTENTFIHWPDDRDMSSTKDMMVVTELSTQLLRLQTEVVTKSAEDIPIRGNYSQVPITNQENYIQEVYRCSDQSRFTCISGSGDPFVVLVNARVHVIDLKFSGTVRIFNSSGFKIPSFTVQLQYSDQEWKNLGMSKDETFYSDNAMTGLTYMQPNRFTDYEFSLPITSFKDLVVHFRCVFENIERETTDYFVAKETVLSTTLASESIMSTPTAYPHNSLGNRSTILSSCAIVFESIRLKSVRLLRPSSFNLYQVLCSNLSFVETVPIAEVIIRHTNDVKYDSLYHQILSSSQYFDEDLRLVCQCVTTLNTRTSMSFENLEWQFSTPWNDVVKVSADLYDFQVNEHDFKYRSRKGSMKIRSSNSEVLQVLLADVLAFVDTISAGVLSYDYMDNRVALNISNSEYANIGESWSRDLYVYS